MTFGKPQDKKPYETPSIKKLTIQQALSHFLNHARELLGLISATPGGQQKQPGRPNAYEAPRLTKLTPEQAKLKLLGYLSLGDQGAKDLLDILFPEPGSPGAQGAEPGASSTGSGTGGTSLGLAG